MKLYKYYFTPYEGRDLVIIQIPKKAKVLVSTLWFNITSIWQKEKGVE